VRSILQAVWTLRQQGWLAFVHLAELQDGGALRLSHNTGAGFSLSNSTMRALSCRPGGAFSSARRMGTHFVDRPETNRGQTLRGPRDHPQLALKVAMKVLQQVRGASARLSSRASSARLWMRPVSQW